MNDGTLKFDTKIDTSGFQAGVSKLAGLAKTGLKTATTAIGAVSTALLGFGAYAVKVGSDFESGMSKVAAISGATGSELEALSAKAKEMGAKTKFSATESAEAFEYMAMAGWKTQDMLGSIDGVMNLAAASGEDLGLVSDIVTDAMTAFGLAADGTTKALGKDGLAKEVSNASHFADVLAKAASNSNTNVGLMGATFKYVAPVAGAMKYSIEDTAVAIGLMANAGIKGEQAGTSLRSMLTRLVKPPKMAADALSELNLTAVNADGSMKPLRQTLVELREKFSGLTDSEKANYAARIAGTEAMSGMLAIVEASEKDFNKLTDAIDHANGAALEQAEIMQDNLQGQLTILKSSVEGLGVAVYDSMETPLKEATKSGIEYVNQITAAFKSGGLNEAVQEAGGIFADLAVKAAEGAPKMVDTAVGFIKSFVGGIISHKEDLREAAIQIVNAMVDGLVKLLPIQIRKPVEETVRALKQSFASGGLKEAVNTVQTVLKNLGTVITKLAKTLLPPLTKAIDFFGRNLKTILPIAASFVVALKTWSIVGKSTGMVNILIKSIVNFGKGLRDAVVMVRMMSTAEEIAALKTAALNGSLTVCETLVALLTGKISLATVAQQIWNAVLTANPIGIVITAVAALAAGIGILIGMQDHEKSSAEQLAEANEKLGESYGGVGEAATKFNEAIDRAKSHLNEFNDTLFASSEEQQALQDNMDVVQKGITDICKLASSERRNYTEEEIQKLDEYFQRLNELNEQQLAIEEAKAEVIRQRAIEIAQTHEGSLAEYAVHAQEWIKTAQEQADREKEIVEQQTNTKLALKAKQYGDQAVLSNEAYKAEYDEIMREHDRQISLINDNVGEVVAAYQDGYLQRAGDLQSYLNKTKALADQEEQENKNHNDRMASLGREKELLESARINDSAFKHAGYALKIKDIDRQMEAERNRHAESLNNIQIRYTDGFDESVQDQAGSWMAMLADTELYGGEISDENKQFVNAFLRAYDNLPDDAKSAMYDAMNGMLAAMNEKEPHLYAKASSIAGGIIRTFKDVLKIASPSKVMRKIFGYVMEGAESGLEDEKPKLYRQTDDIADEVVDRFAQIDVGASIRMMEAAVAASQARMAAPAIASASYAALKSTPATAPAPVMPGGNYVARVVLEMNGREAARATAPFMGAQLAWEG